MADNTNSNEVSDEVKDASNNLENLGYALVREGEKNEDASLKDVGNVLSMISGLMLEKDNFEEFKRICEIYSSAKILEALDENILNMTGDDMNEDSQWNAHLMSTLRKHTNRSSNKNNNDNDKNKD